MRRSAMSPSRERIPAMQEASLFGARESLIEQPKPGEQPAVGSTVDRGQMVRSLSHDFRQPLSAATSGLTALAARLSDRDDVALVHMVEAAVRELVWLFQGTLDYLSVGVAELRPEQKILSLQSLLEDVRSTNELLAKRRGVKLLTAKTSLMAVSDRRYLGRILNNLVVNALSHSAGSCVLLCVRRQGDGCAIEVRDNGRGIPPLHLEDIFRLGWRGDPSPGMRNPSGTGMGLYIVRSFVEALDGDIEVKSEIDRGTRFKVLLPGPITKARHLALSPKLQTKGSLAGKIVAILDDQQPVVESMRVLFESLGATVVSAESELDFLSEVVALERIPDLFILDFMLGRTTVATRCLAVLRQRLGHDNVRAVILTGNPSHPELKNVPNVPVIEKPLSDLTFRKLVAALASGAELQPGIFG
jgi:two-component sensor histidine kinase/CheY-like chemotaxis protein